MSKMFGVSHFEKKSLCFFNILYLNAVLMWYVGCIYHLETNLPGFGGKMTGVRMTVMFLVIGLHHVYPLYCIIKFHLNHKIMSEMIELSQRISEVIFDSKSPRYFKYLSLVLTVCIFWWMNYFVFTLFNHLRKKSKYPTCYDIFCNSSASCPSLMLFLQFFSWAQFFNIVFRTSIRNFQQKTELDSRTVAKYPNQWKARNWILEIRMIFDLKSKILRIYGYGILINQVHSFVNVEFSLLGAWYCGSNLQRLLYLWRFMFYLLSSYLPHWIGHKMSYEVSRHIWL